MYISGAFCVFAFTLRRGSGSRSSSAYIVAAGRTAGCLRRRPVGPFASAWFFHCSHLSLKGRCGVAVERTLVACTAICIWPVLEAGPPSPAVGRCLQIRAEHIPTQAHLLAAHLLIIPDLHISLNLSCSIARLEDHACVIAQQLQQQQQQDVHSCFQNMN